MIKVSVLQAIHWTRDSWKTVSELTISRCFEKCGFRFSAQLDFPAIEDQAIEVIDLNGLLDGLSMNEYAMIGMFILVNNYLYFR